MSSLEALVTAIVPERSGVWKDHRQLIAWSAICSFLLLLVYAPILQSLVSQWWSDPDYGHGFFIPLFAAFVLWKERNLWMNTRIEPRNLGFLVMLAAVVLLLIGSLGAELFLSRISLLLLITGMVLFLAGWKTLRAISFPLTFLIFMIPIPVIIYNQITFPLQLLASRIATTLLDVVGIPVLREGNVIVLSNYSLDVVEACSGIRSLMTLIALAVAYGYVTERRRWARILLILLMVPIATLTNALRIMGAGLLSQWFGQALAEGFLHAFSGWIIFVGAVFLLLGCHRVLRFGCVGEVSSEG